MKLTKMQKSYLRHALGAVLAAALAVVIAHPEWLSFLGAAGAALVVAVIPVIVKALDPSEPDFGTGSTPATPAPVPAAGD